MKRKQAILCVDDDLLVLTSLKSQINRIFANQFIIELAESGVEALEVLDFLQEEGVETLLIISDWLMPNMKGDEFLIQAHKKFPKVSKIMLSGQADESAIQNAYDNADMSAFISKPWKEEDIKEKIINATSN